MRKNRPGSKLYNGLLPFDFAKGIVSEQERNRMTLKIDKWQMPQQAL